MGQPRPFAFNSRRFRLHLGQRHLLVELVEAFALANARQSFTGARRGEHCYNASQFTDFSQSLAQRRCWSAVVRSPSATPMLARLPFQPNSEFQTLALQSSFPAPESCN